MLVVFTSNILYIFLISHALAILRPWHSSKRSLFAMNQFVRGVSVPRALLTDQGPLTRDKTRHCPEREGRLDCIQLVTMQG